MSARMHTSRPSHLRWAFTLVEVLVVISLITLLISMLLPSLGSSRENTRMLTCGSMLRQVGIATIHYSMGNRGYLLPQSVPAPTGPGGRYEWYQNPEFHLALGMRPPAGWNYYNTPSQYICPNARWVLENPAGASEGNNKYALPSSIDTVHGLHRMDLTYGMNPIGIPGWWDANGVVQYTKVIRGRKLEGVPKASSKMYMMDSTWSDPQFGARFRYWENPDATFFAPANNWAIAWRHNFTGQRGNVNVLFYDNHVTALTGGSTGGNQMDDIYLWDPDR
ncbi:MAG: type II secretion system protein [Phycisphaeraceae bacterium]